MPRLLTRIFVTLSSLVSIGFGTWHFFVPKTWNWYASISATATELIVAVRAINVFFSLSLVLFGLMGLFLAFGKRVPKYPLIVILGATSILWLVRVVLQIIHPQGSAKPVLQYGMLAAFIAVFLGYSISLIFTLLDRSSG
jgi:hypothetical protein